MIVSGRKGIRRMRFEMTTRWPKRWAMFFGLISIGLCGSGLSADDLALAQIAAPTDAFLILPLRIHVLESTELPEANCTLTDQDLARIVLKLNQIWHQATIHFGVESVVHEQAVGVDRFKVLRELSSGELPLAVYAEWLPKATRARGMLHVYYVHELPVNGVYLGDGVALVKETADLREVPGGLDEPLPRVTAHELGHALDLSHAQDVSHLMASGTTGFQIDKDEVNRARRATPNWGVQRVEDLKKAAEESEAAGKKDVARRFRSWIAQVDSAITGPAPGDAKPVPAESRP